MAGLRAYSKSMIGKWIDRYQLSGEVGFGGMGVVYQATDTETGQIVAVKLLSHEYLNDLGLRTAFEREAQLVVSLSHEAIVPVFDFGQAGGQPYLVMQYMPNGSLADRLLQGVLVPEEVAPILDRICGAIDYAHGLGIIHRDLKPSNILFDELGQAYLADFGIAWQLASQPTSSPINGTPAYLSPEQALGEDDIDGRCDIYALGIILFESLTGRLPFEGQIPLAILLKQIHDQAPSLRSVDWNLSAGLDEVVQRALAKDPDDRFPTAGELAAAYRQALSANPASLQPASTADTKPERLQEGPPDELEGADSDGSDIRTAFFGSQSVGKPASIAPDSNQIDFLGSWKASTPGKWRGSHLLALSLTTLMGILLAAGLMAFLYLPQRGAIPGMGDTGIQLSYDRSTLVLTNRTQAPLDLSGLSFRRGATGKTTAAEFQASRWLEALDVTQSTLWPEGCYQLLLPGAVGYSLKPGKPLSSIAGCMDLQGWLIVPEPHSWFWIPEGESDSFIVVLNGKPVQTCSIANGSCQFEPEAP